MYRWTKEEEINIMSIVKVNDIFKSIFNSKRFQIKILFFKSFVVDITKKWNYKQCKFSFFSP